MWFIRTFILFILLFSNHSQASYNNVSGYSVRESATGVTLLTNGTHFVQVVELSQGAALHLRTGYQYADNNGSRLFRTNSVENEWQSFKDITPNAFSLINGAFFGFERYTYPLEYYTTISLPLKIDGYMKNYLWETQPDIYGNIVNNNLMLEIFSNSARITAISSYNDVIYSSSENVLVGFQTSVDKGRNESVGRTLIGVSYDGKTIYIFSSPSSTIDNGTNTLYSFGANSVMQLDGSGSSKLIGNNGLFFQPNDYRTIPQTIGISSAYSQPNNVSENKIEVVLDFIERVNSSIFYPHQTSTPAEGGYYRFYPNKSYLYSYYGDLWYSLDDGNNWTNMGSIDGIWAPRNTAKFGKIRQSNSLIAKKSA